MDIPIEYKVTIVIPVYNTEKYLPKCLDSLVDQTLQDIEIVVVNDGSPDGSQKIIDEFVHEHPGKVKGYIKENGGLGDARNFGIEKALGEYIGFVDSDDYVNPEMFEKLYLKAIDDQADMVICDIHMVDETGNMVHNTNITGHTDIQDDPLKYALKHGRNEAYNKLYKKELFMDTDIRYPLLWFEDFPTTPLLIEAATKVALLGEPLYYYVVREGSIMNQASSFSERNFEMLQCLELIVRSKDRFMPDHFYFYMDQVVPNHVFTRYYRDILKIRDRDTRRKIIKKWGQTLNYFFPGWEDSGALRNLKASISSPIKRLVFQNILHTFKTGNTFILDMWLPVGRNWL